jgi:serine/threonine protein kinase
MPKRKKSSSHRWSAEDEARALQEIEAEDAQRNNIVERMKIQRDKELELETKRHREELIRQAREKYLYGEKKEIEELFRKKIQDMEQQAVVQAPKITKEIQAAKDAHRVREPEIMKSQFGYNIIYNKVFKGPYWKTLQARRKEDPNTIIGLTIVDLNTAPPEKKDNLFKSGFKITRWLSQHHSPNLVNVYDIFIYNQDYYIFHEQMTYFLEKFLKHGQPASEYRAQTWGHDLANGISFLHSHGIVHRNICPKTIWLTSQLKVKLGNFSYAAVYYDHKNSRKIAIQKIHIKEAEYHPPEESTTSTYDGTKADVWMWAASVVFMLTKKFPPKTGFEGFQDPSFRTLSDEGMTLLNKCLAKENLNRPSIHEVMHDLWFKSLIETPITKFSLNVKPMEAVQEKVAVPEAPQEVAKEVSPTTSEATSESSGGSA